MFLLILVFLIFLSTFSHMVIVAIDSADTGGAIANLLFSLVLIFCGVLSTPEALPGFWIFMYRLSPFTYLVEGMLSAAVANTSVQCARNEFLRFTPAPGLTCAQYMGPFICLLGGQLEPGTGESTVQCSYCVLENTNALLARVSCNPAHMWRDLGLMWAYVAFNITMSLFLYWFIRTPKRSRKRGAQHR